MRIEDHTTMSAELAKLMFVAACTSPMAKRARSGSIIELSNVCVCGVGTAMPTHPTFCHFELRRSLIAFNF